MAEPPAREAEREEERRQQDEAGHDEPTRFGDVLGISDAPAEVEIPRATSDRGGNPAGVELDPAARPNLPRGKGATGIQMGAGGSGTDIDPSTARMTTNDPDR